MRTWSLAAILVALSGAAHAAPDYSVEIGPGSFVYWATSHEGAVDRYREELVFRGDDFDLYRTSEEDASGEPGDYNALFSGIYYAPCDTEMPTADERAQLAGLWPLAEGASVEIASGDGARFEIGAPAEFFLMGRPRAAYTVRGVYEGQSESVETAEDDSETLIILDSVPLTSVVKWDLGGRDHVLLVTKPKPQNVREIDPDLIGACASLLNEQTEKN